MDNRFFTGYDVGDDDSPLAICPECRVEMTLINDGENDRDDLFRCPDCQVVLSGEQLAEARA